MGHGCCSMAKLHSHAHDENCTGCCRHHALVCCSAKGKHTILGSTYTLGQLCFTCCGVLEVVLWSCVSVPLATVQGMLGACSRRQPPCAISAAAICAAKVCRSKFECGDKWRESVCGLCVGPDMRVMYKKWCASHVVVRLHMQVEWYCQHMLVGVCEGRCAAHVKS